MNLLGIIITFVTTILGLLVTLVTYILKFVNDKKVKEKALGFISISNKLLELITEVEKYNSLSGLEKKNYVMQKINEYALNNNLKYDSEEISNKIEELVNLTRSVNIIIKER